MNNNNLNNLKDLRVLRKKTQSELAKEIGVSESYISLIENGKRGVEIKLAAEISQALDINLDEFFLLYNFAKCKEKV